MNNHTHGGTIAGTVSGTVLTVIVNLDLQDITKTVALAAIGAAASFITSIALKKLWGFIKKK